MFVLNDYATIFPCDPITPPRWRIDSQWYCATLKGALCGAPELLRTDQEPFHDEDFVSTLGGQLYSEEQRTRHREVKLIMHSREAQAMAVSVRANCHGYQGASGIWNFRLGLPEGAVV